MFCKNGRLCKFGGFGGGFGCFSWFFGGFVFKGGRGRKGIRTQRAITPAYSTSNFFVGNGNNFDIMLDREGVLCVIIYLISEKEAERGEYGS